MSFLKILNLSQISRYLRLRYYLISWMIFEALSKRKIFIVKFFSAPRGALWPVPKTVTFPGAVKAQPYRNWRPKLVDLALQLYPQEQNVLWYIMVNTSSHGKWIFSGFTPLWIWKSVISRVFCLVLTFHNTRKMTSK